MKEWKPKEATHPIMLFVEGEEEVRFFRALAGHLDLPDLGIVEVGGKYKFRDRFDAQIRVPGFHRTVRSMGIVRDANSDPDGTFQSIQDALQSADLSVPERPLETASGTPGVTIMLMPGTGKRGMLEDLCLASVSGTPAMGCVEQFFECLTSRDVRPPREISKAKVHAFLASCERPDLRLGEAAQEGNWPWESPAFAEVKRFCELIVSAT